MKIKFYKYQGAGNDFIIIDNRTSKLTLSTEQINFLCDRRFGIGADGLMFLENTAQYDFRMVYFNADGNESTMCGNGGRCIVAFAHHMNAADLNQHFIAIDGEHKANILAQDLVALQMKDIHQIEVTEEACILDTGSPHYVKFVSDVDSIDVFNEGRAIRNQQRFMPKGINVNFAEINEDGIKVRTYERGVEDETLACGTGVTAVAIASACNQTGAIQVPLMAKGGALEVRFNKKDQSTITDVWLTGPAKLVFEGNIEL